MKSSRSLNVKYSLIQALSCLGMCAMLGYASVFLLYRGFSNASIGVVISISSIISTILQPTLAAFVNKTKKIALKDFISIVMGISTIFAIAACFIKSQLLLGIVIIIMSALVMGSMPLITSLTFEYEKHGYKINFGLARGIGSASYAIMSLVLGYLTKMYNPSIIPLFYVISTIGLLMLIYSFRISKDELSSLDNKINEKVEEDEVGLTMIQFVKKYKKFMFLVLGIVLVFVDHSIINTFTIQIVEGLGGDSSSMGNAIFIAAILELPVMMYFMKLKEKVNCSKLIMISAIVFSIKHIIIFLATNMTMIYFAQILQAASYALYLPASVYYVSQLINKRDAIKGQGIIGGATTLASVIASSSGGFLLDIIGTKNLLLFGAVVSVIGTIIVCLSVEDLDNKKSQLEKNINID